MVEYKETLLMPKTDFPMRGGLPTKEPQIQAQWDEMDINKLVLERTEGRPEFLLHDGPPYANGDIHVGHALNKVIKDQPSKINDRLQRELCARLGYTRFTNRASVNKQRCKT